MTGFIVFVIWLTGAIISSRVYYKRRCGVLPAPGQPGLISAGVLGMVWPLMRFVDNWRKPSPCGHPGHARYQADRHPTHVALASQSLIGRSDQIEPKQTALKPQQASDGFNEGDRVRLAKPFCGKYNAERDILLKDFGGSSSGEAATYPAGSKGTIIYPDNPTAEFIAEMKERNIYVVAMGDGRELYAGGGFPGGEGAVLERIPGQYQVLRQNGKIHLRPKFDERDRVRLKESVTSRQTGSFWKAGSEGVVGPLLTITSMEESWRTGYYNVWLDPDPAHDHTGIVELAAEVLELAWEGTGMERPMFRRSQRVRTVADRPGVPAGSTGTIIDIGADRGGSGYLVKLDNGMTIPAPDDNLEAP